MADRRDLLRELQWVAEAGSLVNTSTASPVHKTRERLAWGVAIVLAAATRLDVTTSPTRDPVSLALSPDGRKLVFSADSGTAQLWLRSFDSGSSRPLEGTESAAYPFYRTCVRIEQVVSLGAAEIANVDAAPFGSTPCVEQKMVAIWQKLRRSMIGLLRCRQMRDLDRLTASFYAPSGHVLFVRQGALFAQSFDAVRLALSGRASQVAQQVAVNGVSMAALSTSTTADGPVAYRPGSLAQRLFVWFDRSGRELGQVGAAMSGLNASSLSRDGRSVVFMRTVGSNLDIWLLDTVRGALSPVTSDAPIDAGPVWSPDSSRIVFQSTRSGSGVFDLYEKSLASSAPPTLLLATPQQKNPTDWSVDGHFLLYSSQDPQMGRDIWALPLDRGDRKPLSVLRTSFDEQNAQFSPDGRWIAYESNASGRFEVYVQPFPGPGTPSPISTNGGAQARWRRDGTELVYVALDGRLMLVPIRLAPNLQTVEAGAPVPLFATRIGAAVATQWSAYVVAPDGQRFLVATVKEEPTLPITVVLNWTTLIKQ